jgi:hypothetical protein
MNAIILKGAALRQPPLPQSGPRAKTIADPWSRQCGILNISQPYRPPRLVTGIALLFIVMYFILVEITCTF